jgi:hypothetical protein
VQGVDVGDVLVEEFRALAAEGGQDRGKVLTIDVRFTESGRMSSGLASYVRASWQRVQERLAGVGDGETVLFLHGAGLLGRYADAGGHDLLIALQAAARNPAAAPHGLWLLCPGDSAAGTPQLDGYVVEVVDSTQRLALDGDFLAGLRAAAA